MRQQIKRPVSSCRFTFAIKMGFTMVCFLRFYSIYRVYMHQLLDPSIFSDENLLGYNGTFVFIVHDEQQQEQETGRGTLQPLQQQSHLKSLQEEEGIDEWQVFDDIEKRIMTRNKVCDLGNDTGIDLAPRGRQLWYSNNQSLAAATFLGQRHTTAAARDENHKANGNLHRLLCQLPSNEMTCALGYTTIVTYHHPSSGGSGSHRILFMNLLSLLAASKGGNFASKDIKNTNDAQRNNVDDGHGHNRHFQSNIIVVYDGSVQYLQDDKAYGKRILQWHQEGIVHLMYRSELSEDFGPLYLFDPSFMDYIQDDFVLYLDGTLPMGGLAVVVESENENHHDPGDEGNDENNDDISIIDSLNVGFELLQQNPQALVGCHTNGYKISDLNHLLGNTTVTTVKATNMTTNFLPVCDDDGILTTAEKEQQQQQQQQQQQDSSLLFMRLSGTFLHRNYLCFLSHNTFRPLRQQIQSIHHQYTWNGSNTTTTTSTTTTTTTTTTTATTNTTNDILNYNILMHLHSLFLSSVIPQLSGKVPVLYPLVRASWKGQDKSAMLENQRRRLDDISISHVGDVHEEQETDDDHDDDGYDDDDDVEKASFLVPRRRPRHYIHNNYLESILDNHSTSNHDADDASDRIMRYHRRRLDSESSSSSITIQNHTNVSSLPSSKYRPPAQQQQRQQQKSQYPPMPLTSKIIASVLKYFGIHTKGFMCWCLASNHVQNGDLVSGTQSDCKKICHGDNNDISARDLSWMNDPKRSTCRRTF